MMMIILRKATSKHLRNSRKTVAGINIAAVGEGLAYTTTTVMTDTNVQTRADPGRRIRRHRARQDERYPSSLTDNVRWMGLETLEWPLHLFAYKLCWHKSTAAGFQLLSSENALHIEENMARTEWTYQNRTFMIYIALDVEISWIIRQQNVHISILEDQLSVYDLSSIRLKAK